MHVPHVIFLSGASGAGNLDFIVAACKNENLTNYKIILIHCENHVRHQRLHEYRNQSELVNDAMDNWSDYLKKQAIRLGVTILNTTKMSMDDMVKSLKQYLMVASESSFSSVSHVMENLTEIIKWAKDNLISKGYVINNPPELIQKTAWSSVSRFLTSNGYIYLKQTPPTLSFEPIITQFLYEKIQANVPIVIAQNKELNCFLMKHSGSSLRELLKRDFQADYYAKALKNIHIFSVKPWNI